MYKWISFWFDKQFCTLVFSNISQGENAVYRIRTCDSYETALAGRRNSLSANTATKGERRPKMKAPKSDTMNKTMFK